MEVEPGPRTCGLSTAELQRPQIVERAARLVTRSARGGVARCEHERVQDRLGATRLTRLRQAVGLIGIEWLDVAPHDHALHDVINEFALRTGRLVLAEHGAKRGPGE